MQARNNNTLIVTSHPNKESLTVHAARHAHKSLLQHKNISTLVHLDAQAYMPTMPEAEFMRNFSFEELTGGFQKQMRACTQLALFYPDWWGVPPAPLVGWLQRVLCLGVAFELQEHASDEFEILPRLSHVRMLYAVSSDTESAELACNIAEATKARLAHFAGVRCTHTCVLHNTRKQSHKARTRWIERCATLLMERAWEGESTVV